MRPLPKWHTHPNEPTSILIMMSTERELFSEPLFPREKGRTFSYFITTSVGQPSKIAAGRKSAPKNSGWEGRRERGDNTWRARAAGDKNGDDDG